MDINIKREVGLRFLQPINSIIERKQTKPILANVLLSVDGDCMRFTGTDTDIEFVGIAPLEGVRCVGDITVSAKKLYDIFRASEENSVLQLVMQDHVLIARVQGSRFALNTLPAVGFPHLSNPNYLMEYSLTEQQLRYLFAKTYFSMGIQDSRRYLNGAYLDIEKNSIKCVAMDGHRLAFSSITINNDGDQAVHTKLIVPRKSVLELIRLLNPECQDLVTLYISENRIRIAAKEFVFTSNLINAAYPNYNRLIPQGKMIAAGDRESIKQAIIRVSILSNEKVRGVRCRFEKNQLMMTANNLEREQAEEIVLLDYQGENMTVAFNANYLLDILSVIPSRMIHITLTKSDEAILVSSDERDDCTYIVMPMRL